MKEKDIKTTVVLWRPTNVLTRGAGYLSRLAPDEGGPAMLKQMTVSRLGFVLAVCGALAACNGGSPTGPPPPPPVTTYAVAGTVSSISTGAPVSGAVVTIEDGPNSGQATTSDAAGRYTIGGLQFAGFSISVSAPGYAAVNQGVLLTAGVATKTMNFALLPEFPFSRSGVGDTVFDMPTYITRVHIIGTYTGYAQNFIVSIGGELLVNELMGTGFGQTRYDGILLTRGGVVSIESSSGVHWSITEQR
jgi:hypothetical protein